MTFDEVNIGTLVMAVVWCGLFALAALVALGLFYRFGLLLVLGLLAYGQPVWSFWAFVGWLVTLAWVEWS
jgi:hypothetical protein